jgi:hypothetical protein
VRLEFLGDAFDHFKGAIIRRLQTTDLLLDLGVDPMATDVESWGEDHYRLYADLLGVASNRVLRIPETLDPRGRRALGHSGHVGDLFLDPDTGIRTARQSPVRSYVLPRELKHLLFSNRVIVIYQHAWRADESESVRQAVMAVADIEPRSVATAYVSRQVAMIFFSTDAKRVSAIAASLRSWLGEKRGRILRHP